jgi:hypothetical protein
VVPSDAVDQRGVQPAIVRVKGGKVERVNVELGLRDDARELVEVRTGVAPGDTLLRGAAQGISADAGAGQPAIGRARGDRRARRRIQALGTDGLCSSRISPSSARSSPSSRCSR